MNHYFSKFIALTSNARLRIGLLVIVHLLKAIAELRFRSN